MYYAVHLIYNARAMHAYLYISPSSEVRKTHIDIALNTAHVAYHNRITMHTDTPSIGIAEIRAMLRSLQLAPQSAGATLALVLYDASQLTPAAQQAMLKTLEEPPKHARIDIGAPSETAVLPTIVSRCQLIHLPEEPVIKNVDMSCLPTVAALCSAPAGRRIELIMTIGKSKEAYAQFINQAIQELAQSLRNQSHSTIIWKNVSIPAAFLLHGLLSARQLTDNHIHPQLLLEHIFLPVSSCTA